MKFEKFLKIFDKNYQFLKSANQGIERETLRVDQNGNLSMEKFPKTLGSKLTNPFITTDFAEPQFELITPVFKNDKELLNSLSDIHAFTARNIESDYLWPNSMPCVLPEDEKIPIANYGNSRLAQIKMIYRKGLARRYNSKMQTICGIHFNFSFEDSLLKFLNEILNTKLNEREFRDKIYFKIMRNFRRFGWVYTYFYGASPAFDMSFSDGNFKTEQLDKYTYSGQNATSFRLSDIGYKSRVQSSFDVSFNRLNTYLNDLRVLLLKKLPQYTKIGICKNGQRVQMNDRVLQIENEYYAPIRPKQILDHEERMFKALCKRGVAYLELRSVDLNPFEPLGINEEQLKFLYVFIFFLLFKESKWITDFEMKKIMRNHTAVALNGRRDNLKLDFNNKKISKKTLLNSVLEEMQAVAELIDRNFNKPVFTPIIQKNFLKIDNPDLTLSGKFINALKTENLSFKDFSLKQAKLHTSFLKNLKISEQTKKKFTRIAKESFEKQYSLERKSRRITCDEPLPADTGLHCKKSKI